MLWCNNSKRPKVASNSLIRVNGKTQETIQAKVKTFKIWNCNLSAAHKYEHKIKVNFMLEGNEKG